MGEEDIRQNIRKLLIESLDEVHLTLSGKYVPIDSKECYRDLLSRIADAEAQRNCCDRGTAARMHYNGLLAILRQKAKKHPLRITLIENKKRLNEATLFSTFVQPLSDVFETAKMAALQSLSAVWMMLRTLITFDPEKLKALNNAHDRRVSAVEKKYEDVLKRTNAALTSPDAQIAFMLFAPNLWSSIYAKEWTTEKIDQMSTIYKNDGRDPASKEKDDSKNTKKKFQQNYENLKRLFAESKSMDPNKSNLFEDKSENNETKKSEDGGLKELIESKEFLQINEEMRDSFVEGLNDVLEPLKNELSKINSMFDETTNFGQKMMQTDSIEELKKLISSSGESKINEASDGGSQVSLFDLSDLKEKLIEALEKSELEIQKMSNPQEKSGKSFLALLKAELFKSEAGFEKDQELTPEDLKKMQNIKIDKSVAQETAEKKVLDDVKKGFFTDGKKQIESINKDVAELTLKKFPFLSEPKAIQAIESSDKDLGELIKSTVKILGIS